MEACFYEKSDNYCVRCNLCSHRCVIKDAHRGICGVRENKGGILTSLVYGRLVARNVDPIEKKPFYHFMPASLSYSIATVGCNFSCLFCQNSEISKMPKDRDGRIAGTFFSPESVVQDALHTGCKSIAYTYTEPTVFFEFAIDTAKLAHAANLKNVFVTNGYMTPEALEAISPYLDAANVDLKAFNNRFYKKVCGARLSPVKKNLVLMKKNLHVEITTLLIPGMNDDPAELSEMAKFIASDIGSETPWHISRFRPMYRLNNVPETPFASLLKAREIGMEAGLKYVYTGNVPGENGENTFCHNCGKLLIERWGFAIRKNLIQNSHCKFCNAIIDGIEMSN